MTLYRATDAADTMDKVAQLIAAYCEHTGMDPHTLQNRLHGGAQQLRAHGPMERAARAWRA
ncbi:hypothetical protein [Streptomyces sp. C10-9-1]|uniref:hypothetical protein n=1 Tax=Streptomyces sp. C10-9-1 TaxID=1859285 RepID=UPI003D74F0A9